MHLLLFLIVSARLNTPKRVDEVVYAELLYLSWDLTGELWALVIVYMSYSLYIEDYL